MGDLGRNRGHTQWEAPRPSYSSHPTPVPCPLATCGQSRLPGLNPAQSICPSLLSICPASLLYIALFLLGSWSLGLPFSFGSMQLTCRKPSVTCRSPHTHVQTTRSQTAPGEQGPEQCLCGHPEVTTHLHDRVASKALALLDPSEPSQGNSRHRCPGVCVEVRGGVDRGWGCLGKERGSWASPAPHRATTP